MYQIWKKIFRNYVLLLFKKHGFSISRIDANSKKHTDELNFLDGFLTGLLSGKKELMIVQCGANDGFTVDPLYSFIQRNIENVKAVLIEPLPDVFEGLQTRYQNYENIITLNVAIGPCKQIELFRIRPEFSEVYSGVIASGITSFDKTFVIEKAKRNLNRSEIEAECCVESLTVKCALLSQVFVDHGNQRLEDIFVQVDAEGYDDECIYTINFSQVKPVAINYEVSNLSNEKYKRLKHFLNDNGYKLYRWSKSDEVAILQGVT